jgi:uncharacterized protein YbjQ (UPF0145 family)
VGGLVSAYVVEDDPEHQWADTFRTSRNSNEARQLLLYKLTGRLRRRMGRKVRELSCNAVVGYHQHIELEGEVGLVARGYGTAVALSMEDPVSPTSTPASGPGMSSSPMMIPSSAAVDTTSPPKSQLRSPTILPQVPRTLDQHTPPTPKALQGTQRHLLMSTAAGQLLPLITVATFEPGAVYHIGGVVATRLVRILKRGEGSAPQRERWWTEAREEVRQHALSLGCTHVVGYTENVTAHEQDEVCVLSAVGTAVALSASEGVLLQQQSSRPQTGTRWKHPCRVCHVPYSRGQMLPFPICLSLCRVCGRKYVPEMLLSTCEPPPELPVIGTGRLIQVRAARTRKHSIGESNAVSVSALLPFLEYELHSQLVYKLKVFGMNAVFGLQYELSIGDNMVVAVATGTATYVEALPPPTVITLSHESSVTTPRVQ